MSVNIISSMGEHNELERDNRKIWNLRADKGFFNEITKGKIVVMDENTFTNMEDNMSGRSKIVISSNHDYSIFSDCICYSDPLDLLEDMINEEIYVIGGADIYNDFLPFADTLYLTMVFAPVEDAETYFPYFNKSEFRKESGVFGIEDNTQFLRNKYVRKKVK